MVELFLGGARSGKSRLAEARAAELGSSVTYVATATPGDAEMAERIEHHRRRRPGHWGLVEEPVALGAVLDAPVPPTTARLVDCLTLWLVNALAAGEKTFQAERAALLNALERAAAPVVLVSNEVGAGVVPLGAETRRYVDEAGRLNQDVAARAARVTLVSAGLPLLLKETEHA
ncbi:MAG: bifunctional adenosylcobinamide kinase/adenosylcobinamide-phosphate guanylyltransferase [Pseudomonadota bacterium]